jgi:hypothetical protein
MIIDAWASIKPYIGKKDRDDAAQAFLRTLENYVDIDGMSQDIAGHDGALDRAIANLYGSNTDDDFDDDNDDDMYNIDYSTDEDED